MSKCIERIIFEIFDSNDWFLRNGTWSVNSDAWLYADILADWVYGNCKGHFSRFSCRKWFKDCYRIQAVGSLSDETARVTSLSDPNNSFLIRLISKQLLSNSVNNRTLAE